jgi:hypothetical protein
MHFNVYNVFYTLNSHQHVSATVAAIFSVKLFLQERECTNLVNCVTVTPFQLKIITVSVKII